MPFHSNTCKVGVEKSWRVQHRKVGVHFSGKVSVYRKLGVNWPKFSTNVEDLAQKLRRFCLIFSVLENSCILCLNLLGTRPSRHWCIISYHWLTVSSVQCITCFHKNSKIFVSWQSTVEQMQHENLLEKNPGEGRRFCNRNLSDCFEMLLCHVAINLGGFEENSE